MASLKKRGKTYYARYYVNGKQKAVCLNTSSYPMAKEKLFPKRIGHRAKNYDNLYNPFTVVTHKGNRTKEKRNPHKSYGYLVQPRLGTWVADFLRGRVKA